MAILYTYLIRNQPLNTMVVFKIRGSVPSPRYSPVCNVLRQLKTSLIPIYRVYRLYDYTSTKKHLKMNKEIGMILPKKRVNTSGVGESNNYYEDIYHRVGRLYK